MAIAYFQNNMADKQGRLKRFIKTCKIRVKTKSTKGKKISKSVPLKADKYYRRLGSNLEHSSEELDEATILAKIIVDTACVKQKCMCF